MDTMATVIGLRWPKLTAVHDTEAPANQPTVNCKVYCGQCVLLTQFAYNTLRFTPRIDAREHSRFLTYELL